MNPNHQILNKYSHIDHNLHVHLNKNIPKGHKYTINLNGANMILTIKNTKTGKTSTTNLGDLIENEPHTFLNNCHNTLQQLQKH